MLKFLNTSSLFALLMGLSFPLSAMMEVEEDSSLTPSSAMRTEVRAPQQEQWVRNLFENKYVFPGPTLILENLKKEIVTVSLAHMKAKDNPETQSKIETLQRIMDEESQKHFYDEDLQSLLFNIYSGGILENSVFVNLKKMETLLNKACDRQWRWAFWERAKLSQEHARGELTRDHCMAANYGIDEASTYIEVNSQLRKAIYSTLQTISEVSAQNQENQRQCIERAINEFAQPWVHNAYAEPVYKLLEFLEWEVIQIDSENAKIAKEKINQILESLNAISFVNANNIFSIKYVTAKQLKDIGLDFKKKKDIESAKKWLRIAARRGNREAMSEYGELIQDDSPFEYERILRKSAGSSNTNAMIKLAELIPQEAEIWYRKAANYIGDDIGPEVEYAESLMSLKGDLDIRTRNNAFSLNPKFKEKGEVGWFKDAAGIGSVYSMLKLVELIPQEAEIWYRKAAEKGEIVAMHNLACILKDQGNLEGAIELWRKAAIRAHPPSMYSLGLALSVTNDEEAEKWHNWAAMENYSPAMVQLAKLNLIKGDVSKSLFWLEEAASLGDEYAKKLLQTAEKVHELVKAENANSNIHEQEINTIFEKIENLEPVMVMYEKPNVPAGDNAHDFEIISSDDEIGEVLEAPQINETAEDADVANNVAFEIAEDAEEIEFPHLTYAKQKTIQNPKTRREMLKALGQRQAEIHQLAQNPNRELKNGAQDIANAILSDVSDHIQREHLETLFKDPLFLNKVRVTQTKKGFTVLAHNGNRHINTGTHRKHGQEKFTGHIHPNTRNDLKEILALFNVTQK